MKRSLERIVHHHVIVRSRELVTISMETVHLVDVKKAGQALIAALVICLII